MTPGIVAVAGDWHGLCMCGCGGETRIAPRSDASRGWVKGEYIPYLPRHQRHPILKPFENGNGTWCVPLAGKNAQGRVALIDSADVDAVSRHRWHCYNPERKNRRQRGGPYAISPSAGRMHKFLTGWDETDHINGNGLDNRRMNLRPATHAENNLNTQGWRKSSSKFKGVFWFQRDSKWAAQIKIDGKARHLGYFISEEDAARAYDAAAREVNPRFAFTNFEGVE